jgi:hypothetical protein
MNTLRVGRPASESGVVLIVVLVMLGIFMLIVMSLIGSSNINIKIAGNQQARMEAQVAARHGLEAYISNPANFAVPLPNADSFIGVDFNGDGNTDLFARLLRPACNSSVPMELTEIHSNIQADVNAGLFASEWYDCLGGTPPPSGLLTDAGIAAGSEWCSIMSWNATADVDNELTGAQVTMHQGVQQTALLGTPCPL